MPYITRKDRARAEHTPTTPGELNFALTRLVLGYMERTAPSYARYNDVIGALECCKLELYRRKCAHYEDGAIKRNGDVYV
jgi:uncharacterized protein DUF6899